MSSYGAKEARINQERRARVNRCGECGTEVGKTELLCEVCRRCDELVEGCEPRSTPLK